MTVYWFPDREAGAYRPYEVASEVVHLDVFCKPCGKVNPPRLQRFIRPVGGGPVGVKPFIAEGKEQAAAFHVREGMLKWRLVCPHGHDTYLREADLAATLDAVERGDLPPRVAR